MSDWSLQWRFDQFGQTAQFLLIHDTDGLDQSGAQTVGSFIFGKHKQVFQQNSERLGNQLQCFQAGEIYPALQARHVLWINVSLTGQLFLGQSSLLAQFLDSFSDALLGVHGTPSFEWVISHRGRAANRVRGIEYSINTRRITLDMCGDTYKIAVMRRDQPKKVMQNAINSRPYLAG